MLRRKGRQGRRLKKSLAFVREGGVIPGDENTIASSGDDLPPLTAPHIITGLFYRAGKLTGDNGENRDELKKTPFSLLAPVRKGRVTSPRHPTLDPPSKKMFEQE